MKRFLLILLCAMLFITGCNNASDKPNNDSQAQPSDTELGSSNTDASQSEESETDAEVKYGIIYPTACSVELQNLAKSIRSAVKKSHGVTLKIGNDRNGAETATDYEILLGDTNRSESGFGYEKTGGGGWWVSAEGTRIVINGGDINLVTEAVNYFLENYDYVNDNVVLKQEKFVEGKNELIGHNVSIRVGSYNVKKGIQGKDGNADDFSDANIEANIVAIAEEIKALNLDVVGLQEIDIGTSRTGQRNIMKLIADAAGYEYYEFAKAIDYQGGEYGSAIISKHKIVDFQTVILPRDPNVDSEERAVGIATIDYNGYNIKFLNTHLTVNEDEAGLEAKRVQMRKIAELLDGEYGFMLTGDFNTSDTTIRGLIPNTHLVNKGTYRTFANANPIDDIVLDIGWKIIQTGMGDGVTLGHSDHNLLWAEIKYTGGK